MKTDRISGIVIFAIGIAVFITSLTYPVGTLQKPGGGFFPLISSGLLMILSGVFIFQSFAGKKEKSLDTASFFPGKNASTRILSGVAALVAYRYLIPAIGFAPSTAVFILYLSRFMERYSWKKSILLSLGTAVLTYYIFQVVLRIPMPKPMIKFL